MFFSQVLEALQLITPVFLVILLGWGFRRFGLAEDNWVRVFNNFAFHAALPALSFTNLYELDLRLVNSKLFLVTVISLIVALGMAMFLPSFFKSTHQKSAVIILCASFGNVVYMGYPINETVFGPSGLSTAVMVAAIHLFVFVTVVLAVVEYRLAQNRQYSPLERTPPFNSPLEGGLGGVKHGLKIREFILRICKIPLIWAVILGIVFNALQTDIPHVAIVSLKMLAGAASPVVLFALGVFLSGLSFKGKGTSVTVIVLLKLAVFPALFWLVSFLVNVNDLQLSVSVIQAAMPVGINTFSLADKMQMDKELAATAILITTVLSVATLPVILALLESSYK